MSTTSTGDAMERLRGEFKYIRSIALVTTHVLIMTTLGSTLYFLFNSDRSTVASKALIEEMLSAKRQFIGMVGESSPSNLIFLA